MVGAISAIGYPAENKPEDSETLSTCDLQESRFQVEEAHSNVCLFCSSQRLGEVKVTAREKK